MYINGRSYQLKVGGLGVKIKPDMISAINDICASKTFYQEALLIRPSLIFLEK